jgi:hypothetical protein
MKTTNTTAPINTVELFNTIANAQYVKDSAAVALQNASESIQTAYTQLVKGGIVFGKSVRTCAHARQFQDALESIRVNGRAYYAKGTISNMVSAMRYSLANKVKTLDLNKSRTDAKAKTEATTSTSTKNGVKTEDTKAGTVSSVLTTREKVLVQLENCVTILQNSEDADFDVTEILADVQALIQSLE